MNSTERVERAAMISRIEYLDDQYKKLFHSFKQNRQATHLVEENERLNLKLLKMREERNEQKRRAKELEEQLRRAKEKSEQTMVPMQKYLELEAKCMKEKELRLALESENARWRSSKENVQHVYYKVIDTIEKLKTDIAE